MQHYVAGNLKAVRAPRSTSKSDRKARRVVKRFIADFSPAAQRDGRINLEYLRAIEVSGVRFKDGDPGLESVISEVAERLNQPKPSFARLKRLAKRMERMGGDASACVPAYDRRGGPGKSRLDDDVERVMCAAIDNFYMTIEARSIKEVYEELVCRVQEQFLLTRAEAEEKVPSYSTFRRRILSRSQYELAAARHGVKAAERAFRSSMRSGEAFAFNETWEIDHTVLDLMIVDNRNGVAFKRPRLTVAIEWTTSAVVGFDIDFSGMSSQAVLNCLRHGITPKTYIEEKYPEVEGRWPCHGAPRILKVDNGMEFHSSSVKDACFELGIELQYCPVRQPWYKGRVERFFRTLTEGLLQSLPGAAGPDLQRRKDLEDANLPVIDLETFLKLLHIWIVDVYMTMPVGGKS